jgi:predicted nucleic acid-binding protein
MKALDTPVLLGALLGDRRVRDALQRLRGEEIATTELNLLELSLVAARSGPKVRTKRRASLDRLRRSLTVLPFDSRALERLTRHSAQDETTKIPPLLLGSLAILEANGCDELLTTDAKAIRGIWPYRVTVIRLSNSK